MDEHENDAGVPAAMGRTTVKGASELPLLIVRAKSALPEEAAPHRDAIAAELERRSTLDYGEKPATVERIARALPFFWAGRAAMLLEDWTWPPDETELRGSGGTLTPDGSEEA